MSDIVNKLITLCLNRKWLPVGYKTVKAAIGSLVGSETENPSALAIDIDYERDADGNPMFDKVITMRPVTWSEWITLPIRDWDLTINGATRPYRVPTVVIAQNYAEMPVKEYNDNPSNDSIFARDNYTCQITGEKLSREELNVDHVIPVSRGGGEGWENKVTCRKDINSKKGNKLNSELGIKLIRTPTKPEPIQVMYTIREARHKDWEHFLIKT